MDLKNKPVYYIWDRDNKSNGKDIVKRLLLNLTSAYDDGLLLLSYPCVEAYTIASFEKNRSKLNTKIKDYVKEKNYLIDDINKNKVRRAVLEMLKNLAILNIYNFNIDNIAKINLKAFEKEEIYYDNHQSYIL